MHFFVILKVLENSIYSNNNNNGILIEAGTFLSSNIYLQPPDTLKQVSVVVKGLIALFSQISIEVLSFCLGQKYFNTKI